MRPLHHRPSRARTRLGAGALALASVLAAPLPAGAGTATPDTWTVPAHAWITIKGHGYGHGHGMSQYGAEGAARKGLTYKQIGSFYYPGTAWGTATGRVTVLITADTTDDLVVLPRPGLTVRDGATGVRTTLPDNGATSWRIAAAKNGGNQVSYLAGKWHPFADLEGQGEFAASGRPITLVTPSGNRAYRGKLRAVAGTPGSPARDTVNDLTLESYLKGVVPQEIPASWNTEAVRAQAVAARTYAAYERAHARDGGYQLCDTWSCQVYGGYDAEYPASNAAVDDTRGQVLLAGGEPAFTQFGSSSGGWTSAGSVSYLPAREDPYDDWAGNPVHAWSTRIQDGDVERAWPSIGDLRKLVVSARDGHGDWGGRVREVTIVGSKRRVVVSGDTFRAALGLRSTWLTFTVAARG